MQDNDFEKRVHQKMGELKILPSASVWEQVEMRLLRKEKRRLWILWLPLLFAGLSLGGYILLNKGFTSSYSKKIKTVSEKSLRLGTNYNNLEKNNITDAESKILKINHGAGTEDNLKNKSLQKIPVKNFDPSQREKNKVRQHAQKQLEVDDPGLSQQSINDLAGKTKLTVKKPLIKISGPVNTKHSKDVLGNDDAVKYAQNQKTRSSSDTTAADQYAENNDGKELLPARVNANFNLSDPANITLLAIKEKQSAEIKINRSRYKNWEWGLSISGGRSSLANGTSFNSIFGGALNYSASSSLSAAGSSGSLVYKEPYPLRASVGFSAGAFFKKRLGGRFSISVGINYTNYSTTNKVGLKVDSAILLTSAFNNTTQTYGRYFRSGDTVSYKNKYHFIEVPIILQTQLTRHWKAPIYWDLGFSLSRLITSNALYFDNSKGIYYKDNQLLNKNQLNIITGFPVTIASSKKIALQAGPELRYGLSHVLSNETTPGKHFLFLGLKVGIVLGKK